MKENENLEIKNNDFLRQFETHVDGKLIKLEYSAQPRKIFLTKFVISDELRARGLDRQFLKAIFEKLVDEKLRVVPTCPEVAAFYKAHRRKYKELLPSGITI